MDMGSSSGSSESQLLNIGLKFGQKVYFEDVGVGVQAKSRGGSSPAAAAAGGGGGGGPQKKGRTGVSVQGSLGQVHQPPRCQVEGCNIDLSDAKTYYSRHKVCGVHSKTPKVIVNGLEQRFCQQCSRFHQLPEFDQGKRSCRRRLAGHNERRRKPPPGTLLSGRYGSLSSSIFDNNSRNGGFLMDFSMNSRGSSRVQWPPNTTRSSSNRVANDPPPPWQHNLDNPPGYDPNLTNGGVSSSSNSNCALSLLSNQSSGSRNQTLSLEYYVDPGAHMIEPVGGTHGGAMGQFSGTNGSWGYESDGAHMGLGSMAQADFCGQLGLGQQSGSRYDDSGDHVHWSL